MQHWLTYTGACAALIAASCISWLSRTPVPDIFLFLGLSGVMMAASCAPLRSNAPPSPWFVFLIALVLHVIGVTGIPLFEDDYFRYLWDGYQTAETAAPYGLPPDLYFGDDTIPDEMQTVLDGVNYPDAPTVYGPILQYIFAIGYVLAPANERVLRIMFSMLSLCVITLLLRRSRPEQVALYAWNPLVFKEIPLSGHPDIVIPLLIILAGLSRHHMKGAFCGAALGLAAAVKPVALAVWPVLVTRRPVAAGLFAAISALTLAYAPLVIASGGATDFAGLAVMAREWEFNPILYGLLSPILGATGAKLSLAAAAGCIILLIYRASVRSDDAFAQLHRIIGVLLLVSPVINAWYLLWFLPLAVGRRDIWPWAASGLVLFSYVAGQQLPDRGLALFEIHPIARAIELTGISLALLWDFQHRKRPFAAPATHRRPARRTRMNSP